MNASFNSIFSTITQTNKRTNEQTSMRSVIFIVVISAVKHIFDESIVISFKIIRICTEMLNVIAGYTTIVANITASHAIRVCPLSTLWTPHNSTMCCILIITKFIQNNNAQRPQSECVRFFTHSIKSTNHNYITLHS